MTEEEARRWIFDAYGVSRGTRTAQFVEMVASEAAAQNLVSAASLAAIWFRHVLDSAQLIPLADHNRGLWVDIGTGAGFPGMIVALLTDRPCVLIEPRRRRAAFLADAVRALDVHDRVRVECARAEKVTGQAAVISARAVAALPALLTAGSHLAGPETLWILPKGSAAREEVAEAERTWHGSFHVEHSITEPTSLIVLAKGVARR